LKDHSERQEGAASLANEILQNESLEVVRALCEAVPRIQDPAIQAGLLEALKQVHDQPGVDAIWGVWARNRDQHLDGLLQGIGRLAASPEDVRVFSALRTGQLDVIEEGSEAIIAPLLAACDDPDTTIAENAGKVLKTLKDPGAQDELCRWVIDRDHPNAREIALEAGYTPLDPQRRALFFLLTDQWERYEALDFDASLLRAVYETGDENLRGKIANLARKAGWSGFIQAVAGSRTSRRLEELSAVEWEVVLAILGRHQRWDEIWQLAQSAPSLWSARFLRYLREVNWSPLQPDEQDGFTRLCELAMKSLEQGIPVEKLVRYQATLEGHRRLITALTISPDGELLASASADRTVRLWHLPDGQILKTLDNHTNFVVSLDISPDGNFLASGSADKTVRLWRLPGGELVKTLAGHAGEVGAVAFSPDGGLLASGDTRTVRLWQLPDGKLFKILEGQISRVTALEINSDGKLLLSGDEDKNLHLWRLPGGDFVTTLMDRVAAWLIAPNGELLVSGSNYGRVRLWKLPNAELLETLDGRVDGSQFAISPNGGILAGSNRYNIHLWRLPEGVSTGLLQGHMRPITSLAINPDGRLLASGSEDETVRLWQLPEGRPLQTLEGQSGATNRLIFSPAGNWLISADSAAIRLWAVDDLGNLFRSCGKRFDLQMINRAQELQHNPEVSLVERSWLAFTLALIHWQRRYDIALEESVRKISVGEFDIEIEIANENEIA
jgi:WD40 repeat protein